MSKIDISAEPFCNELMPGKLQLVIQGDRYYFCFQRLHALYSRFSQQCRFCLPVFVSCQIVHNLLRAEFLANERCYPPPDFSRYLARFMRLSAPCL